MSLNCISSVLIPAASGEERRGAFFHIRPLATWTQPLGCLPNANVTTWGQERQHCLHGNSRQSWGTRCGRWLLLTHAITNMGREHAAALRPNDLSAYEQVQSVVYDIITQYSTVFSTSTTENTVLAKLSDPLLIYKSKEKCSAVIFPWLREMPITAVTAPLRHKIHNNKSTCLCICTMRL